MCDLHARGRSEGLVRHTEDEGESQLALGPADAAGAESVTAEGASDFYLVLLVMFRWRWSSSGDRRHRPVLTSPRVDIVRLLRLPQQHLSSLPARQCVHDAPRRGPEAGLRWALLFLRECLPGLYLHG